jgi:hypothetical protein
MANFNLTSQQLKDTYEQLAQVSASLLVDGTGSLSPIVTSSIIDFPTEVSRSAAAAGFGNTAGLVTEATFTAYTASNDSKVNSLTSATSSYALKTEISGAFSTGSLLLTASFSNPNLTFTKGDGTTFQQSFVSLVPTSASHAVNSDFAISASFATNANNLDGLDSTAFAQLALNNNFSGTQNFVNIAVSGTASIAHVQTVTGSAVIIGEEFIILNAATPTARYAGIKIYDTGSVSATASIEWDGVQDTWILMEETGNTSNIITGPTGSRGSETFTTKNRLQKGLGYNYIGDSNITDDGTSVSVSTPLTASSFSGNGSGLTNVTAVSSSAVNTIPADDNVEYNVTFVVNHTADTQTIRTDDNNNITFNPTTAVLSVPTLNGNATNATTASYALTASFLEGGIPQPGLVAGTGTNSIRSAIGATQATASSDNTIVIGNNAKVFANSPGTIVIGNNANSIDDNRADSVIIGNNATSYQNGVAIGAGAFSIESAVAVGKQAQNGNNYGVAIGAEANSGDLYGIAIGYQSTAGNDSIAIGYAVSATTANQINIGDMFKYDGSTSASIEDSLTIKGQINTPVFSGSIVSSTSSIDFNNGNFATLSLTVPTFIANPSNLKSGTTYTIIVNSGSLVTNYGSAFKFPGGVQPTLSNDLSLITMVSDGSRLLAVGLDDFA